MNPTPHFTLEEFERSDIATRHGIDNRVPQNLLANALAQAELMERIRAKLCVLASRDVPIFTSSGYRCLQLNRLVGSKDDSDHPKALARDWTAPSFGNPYPLCEALVPYLDELGIGQLIHEFGEWVHVSAATPAQAINRVITISHAGTVPGIVAL